MRKVAKIAISLPEDVLKIVERERLSKGESRSEFFRRAVEALLRQQQERSAAEEYLRGYRRMPDTAEEIEAAHRAGATVLAGESWE